MAEAGVEHEVRGPDVAGAAHRDSPAPGGHVVVAGVERGLADEGDRQVGGGRAERTELRPEHQRLAGIGCRVRVAGDPVGGKAALQHQLRLGPEVVGTPEHDVGELADVEGADLVVEAVGDGRVDGQLGDVLPHAVVVVGGRPSADSLLDLLTLHVRGELERAAHGLAGATHALRVAGGDADHAEVVQHALGAHRAAADAVA